MSSSAQVLDWIFQMAGKSWVASQDLGDLVHALEDLIDPQANLCSFGTDKQFDVKAFLGECVRAEPLSAFRTLDPIKIHPLGQIRRDGESGLGAFRIQRCQHFCQADFS